MISTPPGIPWISSPTICIADGYMYGDGFRIAVGKILGRRAAAHPTKKN